MHFQQNDYAFIIFYTNQLYNSTLLNKLKMFSKFSKILMILISLQEMCQTVMLKDS